MENTRFQVFVSSTYADLKDEREAVFDAVMKLGHIPAGMEMFPAFDEEQLAYIKTIIDDSDYYVLIIAGRYGSVTEDGVSFTEKEYDYAVEKGIAVLSFVHGSSDDIPVGKTDRDDEKLKRLRGFEEKVRKARNVKFWKDKQELSLQVTQSLLYAIKTKPAIGWIRGNVAASLEILTEINALRKENSSLSEQLQMLRERAGPKIANLASLEEVTTINIISYDFDDIEQRIAFRFRWSDLFSMIGPALLAPQTENVLSEYITTHLVETNRVQRNFAMHLARRDVDTIKLQFVAHGLVEIIIQPIVKDAAQVERLLLTDQGRDTLLELKAVLTANKTG